jgi:hypothetical protein
MGSIGYSKYYFITNLKNCKKYVDLPKIVWERSVRSVGRKGRPEDERFENILDPSRFPHLLPLSLSPTF